MLYTNGVSVENTNASAVSVMTGELFKQSFTVSYKANQYMGSNLLLCRTQWTLDLTKSLDQRQAL